MHKFLVAFLLFSGLGYAQAPATPDKPVEVSPIPNAPPVTDQSLITQIGQQQVIINNNAQFINDLKNKIGQMDAELKNVKAQLKELQDKTGTPKPTDVAAKPDTKP